MAQIVGPSPYTSLGRTWEVAPNDSSGISRVIRRRSSASVATMPPMLTERWRRDPPWVRMSLVVLLAGTAVLYLWGLGASGWANSYYSAAVQAGASSWKAFFFGSSDAANFITVDKAPASLWPMELAARLFGVNAWSILVPQALEGVAAVGLLYATVRRWCSPAAALLAGATLALTPAAALMFRFNNPDALLTLLLTGAAYATVRALEGARTRWLALAFALVGFGFLAKMLQAFLIVPVLVLVYLVAAPTPLRRRLVQLAIGGAALVVSAGWWVAAVVLVPAADRPYIGGSQNNTLLNLMFGYNGFGRPTGHESGGDRALVVHAARPDTRLEPGAALARARRWVRRRRFGARRALVPRTPRGRGRRHRGRDRPRRPRRVLGGDGEHRALRRHPVGRAG